MKKDPFSLFIEESVYYSSTRYHKLINDTKKLFFNYLNKNKSLEEFKKETSKLWGKVDHSYMEQRIKELEDMIEQRDLKGRDETNPLAEFETIYELVPESRFIETEMIYKKTIDNYYKGRLKTVSKEYVDKKSYLTEIVKNYDKIQAVIPYFNKDGTVKCYNNIATYNSMLYNTNLNHSGWNRTMYDSELLGNDLMYLPAHPFACPLCMEWQGKVYSKSGNNIKYPPMELAIKGGVGHPNCKHQWLIYWGDEMLQDNTYNSGQWEENYENKQKIQSLQLERTKLKTDREILKDLDNYEEIDNINSKIKVINAKIKELK